jgi:signal transduction histidine kinase
MIEIETAPAVAPPHALPSDLIHELMTPLGQVIGYSDLLLEKAEAPLEELVPWSELVPDLKRVRAAGRQLQGIFEANFRFPSTLEVTHLPAGKATAPSPGAPRKRVANRADSPLYLLVVDDVEANRDVLLRRLVAQGYSVDGAESGRQALKMLGEHPFDLVLLDIMMPEMDGYEVLRIMKSDSQLRNIPVIMISAMSEMDSVARCIEMGAEDYLTKPFNPILLKARISSSLERKLARDREMDLLSQVQESYRHLLRVETLRDDLTHMIIHDLRTPLTSVIAGLQTLSAVGDLNQVQGEVLAIAVSSGETLVGIISDLLDVEKLESGSMPLNCSSCSAANLIGMAVSHVSSLAEAKGVMLLWDAPDDLPTVSADEHKLQRVLVNLLGNAVKFTPAGGSVTVGAKLGHDAASILFSVRDTGEGIPAESFDRIFEKFGQVDSRQGGRTNSTGLGLTFCKLAVETHGGQIGVESVAGQGSTFWFTIPLPV